MSEERFDRIEQRLDRLEAGQDDLRREMRVLHEEVIDTIKAIPDPVPQIERMIEGRAWPAPTSKS